MCEPDLISIVVPIYNVEGYVEKCVDSIINQTYRHLQIILVDDGSSDASGVICDRFARLDGRIEVVHKSNAGVFQARKTGVQRARGKYIGFVDGDDYIAPDMYQELWECIVCEDADMVHSGFIRKIEGKEQHCLNFSERQLDLKDKKLEVLRGTVLTTDSGEEISISIWSKLFKTELIKRCHDKIETNITYGEDLLILCACLLESKKIYLKKKAFYYYIDRCQSITRQSEDIKLVWEYELYQSLCELFKQYGCYEDMKDALYLFFKRHIFGNVLGQIRSFGGEAAFIQKFMYPTVEELSNKKIIIYGAGEVGKSYYAQICKYQACNIVAWVDKYPEKYHYDYTDILSRDQIKELDYDVIVLAVQNEKLVESIKSELEKLGVDGKKVIWKEPISLLKGCIMGKSSK